MANAHLQQQILAAWRIDLQQASTLAGDRVRAEGRNARAVADLPAIDIGAGDESDEPITGGKGGQVTLHRELMVDVICIGAGDGARDTAMEIQAQIEECMGSSLPGVLSGLLISRPRLRGIRGQWDDAAAQPIYTVRGIWQCRYLTAEGAPRGPAATSHP